MNKKGFTLVELLAVIAILAILVIIALPNVLSMFNDAREKSFTTELKEVYKVAQQSWISDSLMTTGEKIYSKKKNESCPNPLDLSGRNNLEYFIRIAKSGAIQEFYASDGTFQYVFEGDGLSITDIKDVTQIANMSDSDPVLTIECSGVSTSFPNAVEDATQGTYYNASKNKYYDTLKDAFAAVGGNQTIKLLNDASESEVATIASGLSNVKLDLNGKTLDMSSDTEYKIINNGSFKIINSSSEDAVVYFFRGINNNGTITIDGNYTLTAEDVVIKNNGTANIAGGSLTSGDGTAFENNGTLNITGGYLSGYSSGVSNNGILNVTGGTFNGNTGIFNSENGTASISNNVVIKGYSYGIDNEGTLNMTDAGINVNHPYGHEGLRNKGTATLTNVNIYITNTDYNTWGIYNFASGNLTFNSGTITAAGAEYHYGTGIGNEGTATINAGTIKSTHSKTTGDGNGVWAVSGTMTIIGGEIDGCNTAIVIDSGATITLGKNDGTVSTTSPIIFGNGSNSNGVKISSGGTLNFYDGIIKATWGTNHAITGTPNTPTGYVVSKTTTNGVETAILVQQ